MVVIFDPDFGLLRVTGNTNCDVADILREMDLIGPEKKTSPLLQSITVSGTACVTINHASFLNIGNLLTIGLSQTSSLIINIYPDMKFQEVNLVMTGASTCTIYNTVVNAQFSLAGKTTCTVQQPIENFSVESISSISTLRIAGEPIKRTMKRSLNPAKNNFRDEMVDKYQYSCSLLSSSVSSADESPSHTPIVTAKRPVTPAAALRPNLAVNLKPVHMGQMTMTVSAGPLNLKPRLPTRVLAEKKKKKTPKH